MSTNLHETFLLLVRLGIGHTDKSGSKIQDSGFKSVDWVRLKDFADRQGLSAVVLDALNTDGTNITDTMPVQMKLEWIGEVLQMEARSDAQKKVAETLGELFHANFIRTYVLKGAVIAECYPNPKHRLSADMDCFLRNDNDNLNLNDNKGGTHEEAWKLGNDLVRAQGYEVGDGFYKNSSFHLPGLMVENHRFMTPFRGNKKLRDMERVLQSMMYSDEGKDRFEGAWLYRPPIMVSALFLIEHAYSHFLHEGLTWRMVLDWMLFSEKHRKEICWSDLDVLIDEFGFRKFYDSFCHLGKYIMGELSVEDLNLRDKCMLEDIWAPLDLHESLQGVKAKFQLAGNYWRARWKYKYFTEMTWVRALMEWVTGAVFDRNPKLD